MRTWETEEKTPRPPKLRSAEQNARMWAMLGDLAKQVLWPVDGEAMLLSPDDWKTIISAGLGREQRIAKGMNGGFVALGMSTSRMTTKDFATMIELMLAFGAQHGVAWSDPTVIPDETLAEEFARRPIR